MSTAFRISNGELKTINLKSPEPFSIKFSGKDITLLPGSIDENFETGTMPVARDMIQRMVPWSTWYFSPTWSGCDTSGWASGADDAAIIRIGSEPYWIFRAVLHEIWHLVEVYISSKIQEYMSKKLLLGPKYPGEYMSCASERCARSFEHFGMLILDGLQLYPRHTVRSTEMEIFWSVFSGEFAREVVMMKDREKKGIKKVPVLENSILSRAKRILLK